MPVLHPLIGGVQGKIHTRTFRGQDMELAVIVPAKCMAMTVIDLLSDGAESAKRVVEKYEPKMTKKSYLAFMDEVSRVITA